MARRVPARLVVAGVVVVAVVVAAVALAAAPGGSAPSRAHAAAPATPAGTPAAAAGAQPFDRVLIADRGNGRLLVVDRAGHTLWQFPAVPGVLPSGHQFSADDAFFAPDGKTIVANDEDEDMLYRID